MDERFQAMVFTRHTHFAGMAEEISLEARTHLRPLPHFDRS